MIEIIGGVLMATFFFFISGKLHGVAKAIAIVMGILSICIGVHGVSAVFF